MRIGKDPGPYFFLWLTDPDADPGGPKHPDPDVDRIRELNFSYLFAG
jgi:hypothetical protein